MAVLRLRGRSAGALVCCCLLSISSVAAAQATLIDRLGGTAGYGPDGQCLSPNDDGSSAGIDIRPYFPGGLRFFTTTPHTRLYVNTNGNITFSGAVSDFTAEAFPITGQPMIAPYWADVDIRNTGGSCMGTGGVTCDVCEPCHNPSENGVWWYGEAGRMIFTWDRVGRYDCNNDLRMSFQLVLTAVEGCAGAGDFDVEFRFNRCEWEVGDASGDESSDGFCQPGEVDILGDPCVPAQSGFDAGNGTDFVAIMGSMTHGINTKLCTMSNVGEPGIWRFQIRSGSVVCPGAGDACDTGMAGVCATGRTNCVGTGTECVPDVAPSPERCDALDNNCNGQADENPETLCPAGQVCESGRCLTPCFELGCPSGQVCTASGRCLDSGCEGVTCPAGQRCSAGSCVDACDGVTCPADQTCRGGLCVDLCEGLACDDCTVCQGGDCVARCQLVDCPSGQSCLSDGRCVESACATVSCAAGTVCRAGTCVDSCDGAVCPDGQECRNGDCVALPLPDAGPPRADGGGVVAHDAGASSFDGGSNVIDGGDGHHGPPPRPGCGCHAVTDDRGAPLALLLAAIAMSLTLVRRRR